MLKRAIAKALLVWLAILVLAIANGALREAVLLPALGTAAALALSALLLSALILAVTWLAWPWLGLRRTSQALAIGALWLALTIAFEFTFGRLVLHKPWPELLSAYTFEGGNLWPLVLLVTVAAPAVAQWTRRGRPGPDPG